MNRKPPRAAKPAQKKPAPKKSAPQEKPAQKKSAPPKKAPPKKSAPPQKAPAKKSAPPKKAPPQKALPKSAPPLAPPAASPAAEVPSASGPVRDPLVLWLAAEAVPWAHTGGLGDVIGSLPAVLRQKGWDVRLCLPLYTAARRFPLGPPILTADIPLGHGRSRIPIAIREAIDPPGGVPTYLVECALFDRPGIYGDGGQAYPDNALRYGVWQLAARELAATLEPALIHCHDWHAALIPTLAKMPGQWPAARGESAAAARAGTDLRTIFTIHNLEFQGHTVRALLDELGLPRELWHPQWLEHFGGVNFLKGAILSADRVTTVSRSYADEIRTPAFGMGLDGPLRDRGADVTGIVNGIDVIAWDPATDPQLPARFDVEHLAGRAACKAALRADLGLPGAPGEPLIGFIGRLTDSKGVDLLIGALPSLLALGAKVVVLGSGDRPLEAALQELERAHPQHFRAVLRFDAALARRTYAGADMMIVPSRVEPCGLVQLYALRYGAVPVVHAVGGLRDTVTDGQTGFVFQDATPRAITAAVRRALEVFADPPRWNAIVAAGMRQDWSWVKSAAGYDQLYRDTLAEPPRVRPLPAPADDQSLFVDYGPDLPPALGRDELRLMVQGPACVYAYWETVSDEPLDLVLEERPTGYAFVLCEQSPAVGDFWIAALPEHAYRAMLCRRDGTVVRVSNAVLTGRDRPVAPGEETPVWLERLLASASVDDPSTADRWSAIFPAGPIMLRGTRYWDGGQLPFGDAASGPGGHTPGSIPPLRPPSLSAALIDRERGGR